MRLPSGLALLAAAAWWPAAAADLPRTDFTVIGDPQAYQIRVGPAVRIPVRIRELLPSLCRSGGRSVVGCTFFAEEKLQCDCRRGVAGWRIAAVAEFVPVMYLYKSFRQVEAHEQLHVDDVTAMLQDYLREVVVREFSTEQDCRSAARSVVRGFTPLMNGFRAESNRRLR